MSKTQIIRKKCCGKVFAACIAPHCYTDKSWIKDLAKYVKKGHEIDLVDSGSFRFESCTCELKPIDPDQLSLFPKP